MNMKQFNHIVKDPLGLHARPAGMIAKLAKSFADTTITVSCNGKDAKASALMKLMSLGVKEGNELIVTAEGASEDAAIVAMQEFFQNNL